jgi:hypothetical protein
VFLCYATNQGAALVDRELVSSRRVGRRWPASPRGSGAGRDRVCHQAGVGTRRMIERALAAGAPCSWIAADEVYGNNSKLRQWLEERRLGYAGFASQKIHNNCHSTQHHVK